MNHANRRAFPIVVCAIGLAGALLSGAFLPGFAAGPQDKAQTQPKQGGAEQIVIPPGKESLPAEQVFKNIEILKGKPASRLPGMMSALNGLLGVHCTHCHVQDQWDKEEPPAKITARHMFSMIGHTNEKYLKAPDQITCWTCHRGSPTPLSGNQEIPAGLQSLPPERKKLVDDLLAGLGDNKTKPAEQVFHNISMFKGVPAQQVLRIMTVYTIVLGVDCSHCHVPGEWEKDDKAPKVRVATMAQMARDVNQELFDGKPTVTCYTCHRGLAKPENLPEK